MTRENNDEKCGQHATYGILIAMKRRVVTKAMMVATNPKPRRARRFLAVNPPLALAYMHDRVSYQTRSKCEENVDCMGESATTITTTTTTLLK